MITYNMAWIMTEKWCFSVLFDRFLIIVDNIGFYINQVRRWADKDSKVILIANKCDLIEERKVSSETGKTFADVNNLLYFEVSCKSLEQIELVFVSLVSLILTDPNEQTKLVVMNERIFKTFSNSNCCSGCYLL